jgi:CheY-like chemotaxis protein
MRVDRIPCLEATAETARERAPDVNLIPARRRVLVVDDNTDAAESLAALLRINGHDTRLAHDGPDALREAEAFHPDVVFLDIGMPTLDGHETARLIRQQPWGRNMVLVALTGWGQVEDRRRSKAAGFNHHLVKPADPAVVANLIASLG